MDIRLMNETEYGLSKKLWLECFPEDGEYFVEHYYSTRSKPEYVLGAFEIGEAAPVSMMHIIPVMMRFNGIARRIALVAGVCTCPDKRGRGLCTSLFDKAFDIMSERGFDATVLQPFDPAFYERFGYKTFIWRKKVAVSADKLTNIGQTYENISPDPAALARLYSDAMRDHDGCTIRDEAYFSSFIGEYSASDAVLYVTENGCCAGYADGNRLAVTELFYRRGIDPVLLLPAGFDEYVYPVSVLCGSPPGSGTSIEPFSMIKTLKNDIVIDPCRCFGFDRY